MSKSRLVAAATAAAVALGLAGAPTAFAATAKPVKPPVHKVVKKKVHHVYVTGKIVKIDVPLAMVKLSNGKTYRLVNVKDIAKYKVGHKVRLQVK